MAQTLTRSSYTDGPTPTVGPARCGQATIWIGESDRQAMGPTGYLPAPAVRPPMSLFSISENRITTGTIAIMATVNRYCQSLM